MSILCLTTTTQKPVPTTKLNAWQGLHPPARAARTCASGHRRGEAGRGARAAGTPAGTPVRRADAASIRPGCELGFSTQETVSPALSLSRKGPRHSGRRGELSPTGLPGRSRRARLSRGPSRPLHRLPARGALATHKLKDEEQVGEGSEDREATGQGAAPRSRCGGHAGELATASGRDARAAAPR